MNFEEFIVSAECDIPAGTEWSSSKVESMRRCWNVAIQSAVVEVKKRLVDDGVTDNTTVMQATVDVCSLRSNA